MKIFDIGNKCTGCMACYNACPGNAISMVEDDDGFFYPHLEKSKCNECLLCEKTCPEIDEGKRKCKELIQLSYYGWHNDDTIRKKSSSGGVFTALVEYILNKGGVIFGAGYDKSMNMVLHKSTDEVDLSFMRKSKYVQSYIGDSFSKAKEFLGEGRHVLFTGTPCQLSGLQGYLGYDHEKLVSCDFICHGVPPMKLLNEDLALLERKYRMNISGFDFRPKIKTWTYDYFTLLAAKQRASEEKRRKINIPWYFDGYFHAFSQNYSLRKSCYNCRYSATQHGTDLTIADYWGYRRYDESIFDERGLSLVMANTNKGRLLIQALNKNNVTLNPIDWKYVVYVFHERNNKNYNLAKRNAFFGYYLRFGYANAIKHYSLQPSFNAKARRLVADIASKYLFASKARHKARKLTGKIFRK